jgi:pSer/pThr/pTyr-binding forkhead associated (FHA) protein
MPYAIRVLTGPDQGEIYPLFENREITIGHGPTCNILVADKYVSRFHCQIVVAEGRCRLTDLESTNGTFVNEERVTDCELKCGCQIRVGKTLLGLEEADQAGRLPTTELAK